MSEHTWLALIACFQPLVVAITAWIWWKIHLAQIAIQAVKVATDGMKEGLVNATANANYLQGATDGQQAKDTRMDDIRKELSPTATPTDGLLAEAIKEHKEQKARQR